MDAAGSLFTELRHLDAHKAKEWYWVPSKPWAEATKQESGRFLHFCKLWYDKPFPEFRNFPGVLSLGLEQKAVTELRLSGNQLLVTAAYQATFDRILEHRLKFQAQNICGAVLTGQPGIGKTTFLFYMLARLLSRRHTVLLYGTARLHLFHQGNVYVRPTNDGIENLPGPGGPKNRVWTLIDGDSKNPPDPHGSGAIWPIQASSPNSEQWRRLEKHFGAVVWGMPPWTREELLAGLLLQGGYEDFRQEVADAVHRRPTIPDPLDTMTMSIEVQVAIALNNLDDARDPVGTVIDALADDAIWKFGYCPRDFYVTIFNPDIATKQIQDIQSALRNLDYTALHTLAMEFGTKHTLPSNGASHRIILVSPTRRTRITDSWTVDFKSVYISKEAVALMMLKDEQELRQRIAEFSNTAGSALAGRFFEALAHRKLSQPNATLPPCVAMSSEGGDAPLFRLHPDPSDPPETFKLHIQGDTAMIVDFTGINALSTLFLDDDDRSRYYIPKTSDNPLFDAFTVAFHHDTAVITIIQVAMSQRHEGSAQGYSLVRKIVSAVRSRLSKRRGEPPAKKKGPNVTVRYLLVCLETTNAARSWKMPRGWNENFQVDDHRGEVFCMKI